MTLRNSIVSANFGASIFDIEGGAITYGGNNLIGNVSAGSESGPDPLNGFPQLAPLGDYGGPTLTMPPLSGSPAIDAGGSINPGGTDQRGFPFVVTPDIGAVEFQGDEGELAITFDLDSDRDGSSNGLELAIGSDPLVSDADHPNKLRVLGFGALDFNESTFAITFGYVDATIPLRVTRSTDLITFVSLTEVSSDLAGGGAVLVPDPNPPAGEAFYRLEAIRPE